MSTKLHLNQAAEREATDIGAKFMHSSDVVGDMSRVYGRDLSSVRIHTDESAARGAAERGVDAFSTGKDVFFARGAFDRSDPASRGLLAHELSHSMQQGVGGGAPATAQSAPMGAEQGGLREWFKGLFGKSGDAGDFAPEQETDASEPDAQLTQNNDPQKELDDAAEALRSSKKWGWSGNTETFERVSNAIDASIGQLSAPLSGDPAQDQGVLDDIIASFDDLILACDDYLSRDPRTDRGKHRQAIVRQVRELAVKDRGGFVRYMKTPDEGAHFTSAMDVLTRSRQRTLQLVDKNEDELQHVGGAASYIAKIDKGMLTDQDTSGFFKEDETFTNFASSEDMRLSALESVRRRKGLTDQQFEEMKEIALSDGSFEKRLPDFYKNRALFEGVALYRHLISAQNTVDANLPNPLGAGETLNLSKRNVATSRLAELLGLGDLVAKSETATLVDAGGKSRSGNLMQAAQGQEVTSFILEQYQAQYKEKMEEQYQVSSVDLTTGIEDKVTPEFLKSLMALQVLDNLAAQSDRHSGNYFAQIKDGKLGKVQAIDNDFSFSNITLDWEPGTSVGSLGSHGFNILDQSGNLRVPYMDRALADRITALDESVLRDVMADILEPWAIDALCVRFNQIKTAIQKEQAEKPDSGRFLERDEDWASEEVFSTLRDDHAMVKKRKQATNYVANVLAVADFTRSDQASYSLSSSPYLNYWTDFTKNFLLELQQMDNAEQIKDRLREYLVKEDVISYLESTGQLFDGPALLNRIPNVFLATPIQSKAQSLRKKKFNIE